MSNPIVFTSEQERLKAREQFVATLQAVYPNEAVVAHDGRRFDAAFPPIAPPKMVPYDGWALLYESGGLVITGKDEKPIPTALCRVIRVRVEEVDE